MTEATQTATTDAREASMSRVTTQDTILEKLAPQEAAKVPAEGQTEAEKDKDAEKDKPKKGPGERIRGLITERNALDAKAKDAEARAEAAEREAQELKDRIKTMSVQAKPIEANPRPERTQYADDDSYTEALADWKADQKIAKREEEHEQARVEAERAEVFGKFQQRQAKVLESIPDYAEVIGKSEMNVPDYLATAIVKSPVGPQIGYYLALHPTEAAKFKELDQIDGIKRFRDLERDLSDIEKDEVAPGKPASDKHQKSKAPEPIDPPRSNPSSGGSSTSFEEYKRRRKSGQ